MAGAGKPPINLDNVQGDLFSRGFPKYHETYYFFTIKEGQEKYFAANLKTLVAPEGNRISTLRKVLDDWDHVDAAASKNRVLNDFVKREVVTISNVLIAFTRGGLDAIQTGVEDQKRDLGLSNLALSDPAFDGGMSDDRREDDTSYLNDPPNDQWEALWNNDPVHGLLKIAGDSPETIERKLLEIKKHLNLPFVDERFVNINDIGAENKPPLPSRLDGNVRPKAKGMNGYEHFGFRDGISQPLIRGVNSDAEIEKNLTMETPANIIICSSKPPGTEDGIKADPTKRPSWMVDGSFLVFRKLEQDVKAWNDLVKTKYSSAGCKSPGQLGAKLMGRWPSGAPIVHYPDDDAPAGTKDFDNNFDYKGVKTSKCPLGAHLRKVNPRVDLDAVKNGRIIRNGIPYGTEYDEHPEDKNRGLLFVCYQSSIENGFRFVQEHWSNRTTFPTSTTGFDPLIGQAANQAELYTTMYDSNEGRLDPGLGRFKPTVKLQGGDYFFVPSISALRDWLGRDPVPEPTGGPGGVEAGHGKGS